MTDQFNNIPLLVLKSLTPLEVLNRQISNGHLLTAGLAKVVENRKLINRFVNCSELCKVKRNSSF